jgi:hypothetical protein
MRAVLIHSDGLREEKYDIKNVRLDAFHRPAAPKEIEHDGKVFTLINEYDDDVIYKQKESSDGR